MRMEPRGGSTPPGGGPAKDPGTRPKTAPSRPPSPGGEDRMDRVERIIKMVVDGHRCQQDRLDAEAQRQDQRWKAMEHQFQQLQRMVRDGATPAQAARQPVADLQQGNSPVFSPGHASPRPASGYSDATTPSRFSCRSSARISQFPELYGSRPGPTLQSSTGVETPKNGRVQ